MKCSFCGKESKRYATSVRSLAPTQFNYHCFRWWCRLLHWLEIWWDDRIKRIKRRKE